MADSYALPPSLTRSDGDEREGPILCAFLDFLADDIKARPEGIRPMSDAAAARMRDLTEGIEVDLDGDFRNASPL